MLLTKPRLHVARSRTRLANWGGAHLFFPEGEGLTTRTFYGAMDQLARGDDVVEARLVERLRAHPLDQDDLYRVVVPQPLSR